jgi:starch-binding outer membrane protein SusE/F
MKANLKYLPVFLFAGIISCKKVETKVYFEGGTAPQLTASTTTVRLEPGEENNGAIRLSWTNPNYKFNTGLSSQNVSYLIEIDTVGANFTNSKKYEGSVSSDLSKLFTVDELNQILGNRLQLQIDPRRTATLEARITSSISNKFQLVSNKITFTARPFPPPAKVEVPGNDRLWIVGDATPGGWNGLLPNQVASLQEFTRVSRTLYELTLTVPGGGRYKLLPAADGWGKSYRPVGATDPLWNVGEFEQKDANPAFIGPPNPGSYKFTFDFQLGTFKVEKQ